MFTLRPVSLGAVRCASQRGGTSARFLREACPVRPAATRRLQATVILSKDPKLARRRITAVAVCPGSCNTDMNPLSSGGTAADGAAAVVFAVQHPDPASLNGKFFMRGKEIPM